MRDKLVHIYYGDGKGKTTAAVGLAYRCAGRGEKVLFTAFLKGKDSGEFINDGPFYVDDFDFCNKFWNTMSDDEKHSAACEARKRLDRILDTCESYDMVVLDEFLDAAALGCIDKSYAIDFVSKMRNKTELVITGHQHITEIFAMADYITQMKNEKHPYDDGICARCGIEY